MNIRGVSTNQNLDYIKIVIYTFLQSVILDGFQIPKGYAVAYLSRNANMDPTVFKDPEKFLPERWEAR
jgi:cytochrome P450